MLKYKYNYLLTGRGIGLVAGGGASLAREARSGVGGADGAAVGSVGMRHVIGRCELNKQGSS